MQIIQCVTLHCIMTFEKINYLEVVELLHINEGLIKLIIALCTYKCSFKSFSIVICYKIGNLIDIVM